MLRKRLEPKEVFPEPPAADPAPAPAAAASSSSPPPPPLAPAAVAELRDFDLTQRFGPCVGLSRAERWQRAYDLGKEPPARVMEILRSAGPEHAQSVMARYPL